MPSRQARTQEDTAFRIMRISQESPNLSQHKLKYVDGLITAGTAQ